VGFIDGQNLLRAGREAFGYIPCGEEKGIDVRIELDITRIVHRRKYDVGFVLS
jgi:uncharacterized LabA/DUF88 family protein